MKIIINYDLLQRIAEAKKGFSLIRTSKNALIIVTCFQCIELLSKALTINSIDFQRWLEGFLTLLPFDYLLTILGAGAILSISGVIRREAIDDLDKLASKLNYLNIDTDDNLLLNSYKYHMEYAFDFENKIPSLIQKKYINIPVTNKNEEVSILQEHIIGTNTYVISKAKYEKQRQYRLAFNN